MKGKHGIHRILTAALALLMVVSCLSVTAFAADEDKGLSVEKLNFRDVLLLYTAQTDSFGVNAEETDDAGVTNAAKRLAVMYAYTVGLNYSGEGLNSNYFSRDITGQMESEPYTADRLKNTFAVDIMPYHGYANATKASQTLEMRVYLAGQRDVATGAELIYHYVWQENGSWFAVKDDNPYYKVSYNGMNVLEAKAAGYYVLINHGSNGTDALGTWSDLEEEGELCVHCDGYTLVAGQGSANIFGVTAKPDKLKEEGGFAPCLIAVSDFVEGNPSYQTGPLVYSRDVYESDSMRRVPDGESLTLGSAYQFRVVYDEALYPVDDWSDFSISCRCNGSNGGEIRDFVWYGEERFLDNDRYNPHAIEFVFVPSVDGTCEFRLAHMQGSESRLTAAPFHATCGEIDKTPAPVAEATPIIEVSPTPTPTANPVAAAVPAPTPTPAPVQTVPAVFGTQSVTRGALAEALWSLAGEPSVTAASFTDMPTDNARQIAAISWAAQNGLIVGYGNGAFGTNDTVSREQAAVILCRYAISLGKSVTAYGSLSAWADGSSVSSWATSAVLWALNNSLLKTEANGSIAPQSPITGSDLSAMLTSFVG